MTFKVGDEVKIVGSYLAGLTGFVTRVNPPSHFDYYVKNEAGLWGLNEDELELLNA